MITPPSSRADTPGPAAAEFAGMQAGVPQPLPGPASPEVGGAGCAALLADVARALRGPLDAIADAVGTVPAVASPLAALQALANDLLDLARIEAGALDMESVDFRISEVADDLLSVVGPQAALKALALRVVVEPGIATRLLGDPMRLSQVLNSLAAHVVQQTSTGEVLCRIDEAGRDAGRVTLRFSIGAAQPDALQPVDGGFAAEAGIGGAVSRRLVHAMGGTLVADGPAHARRFQFALDFAVPAEEGAALAAAGLRGLRGRRVLLVDGHAPSLQLLAESARALGLEVEIAHDGWDAMRAAAMALQAGRAFEFAVIDMQLPGMEGTACARQLLETTEGAVPVLLMTTVAARDGVLASLRAQGLPVRDVLAKPVGADRLAQACLAGLSRPAAPPARDARVQPDNRRLAGMRLLLVDDNLINQELACDMLQRAGAQVTVAGNGQEALDALSTLSFDGVLMDLQMPVMDGYEATRAIRAQPRWRDLPIIAMTASAQPQDRAHVLAAGMNDHVGKPVDPQRLIAALAHWVGGPGSPRPAAPLTVASVPSAGAGASATASSRPADASLDRLPGIDASVGRANTMGNDRLYRRLLLKFREGQHDVPGRLQAAWDGGDRATARRLAHDLAGVSGTLGAMGVHLAARAIEAVCAGETGAGTLPVLMDTLREELTPVIAGLGSLGGE